VTQIELKNFLEIQSVDIAPRKQEIKAAWQGAVARFEELRHSEAGTPDSITTRPLSAEYAQQAETLRADLTFANTFSNFPYSFEEVRNRQTSRQPTERARRVC